jgi:DNA-binding Lrp family transcriptional regulator
MSGADIDAKILEVLRNAPHGLSQIAISEATGVSYASVVKWLKENGAKVRTEGERKGKRVFLV